MNRTLSTQARLTIRVESRTEHERRMRTRTLIQAGGLIVKAGLFDICQIEPGEDLQKDIDALDKAAMLLGILVDASEKILEKEGPLKLEQFRQTGVTLLKLSAYA